MKSLLVKFLVWRIKHISNKNFVLIISGIVGVIAGLAAVTLKTTVHLIQNFLSKSELLGQSGYLYLSLPFFGILLTALLAKYIFREQLGHGITSILYAISKKSSIIRRTNMYSRMVTSAVTVGLGGSVGLEAPIVMTGSALGSNLGRLVHLDYKQRTLLIGCGAAGAISAIFDSPIAGVIFAVEVILTDVTIASLIPLLISSVFASLISLSLRGVDLLLSFNLKDPFKAADFPYYILLGIICGLVSVYFTRMIKLVERFLDQIKKTFPKAIVGGLGLGVIIFFIPPIYGEGYDTIKSLLEGNDLMIRSPASFFPELNHNLSLSIFVLIIFLVKPIATALTIGAGGSGGVFAPSLFVGGTTGFFFSNSINYFTGQEILSLSNFTLVGMCGVMSGVLHAPLTAIFLIAEITSGYTLFVPLMLVSALAYTASNYFESYSLYAKRLVQEGDLIPHDKDRLVLSQIDLKKIIEKDLVKINQNEKLGTLVNAIKNSTRNIFPIVDDEEKLMGIVTLDDVREIIFDPEMQETLAISSIMHKPPAEISSHENMQSVMSKFEVTGAWNLPVIDNGKYIGFVSKSRIFNTYRKKLIRQTKE